VILLPLKFWHDDSWDLKWAPLNTYLISIKNPNKEEWK
jgi:hypothetical protein